MDSRNVIFYTRYVDDILIVYDSNNIQPKLIETHTNQIHNNIKLKPTQEENVNINVLELNTKRKPPHLEIDI
jgi:DNA-binding GntR family transcriptional regulator